MKRFIEKSQHTESIVPHCARPRVSTQITENECTAFVAASRDTTAVYKYRSIVPTLLALPAIWNIKSAM
jgi:hypothetical protein